MNWAEFSKTAETIAALTPFTLAPQQRAVTPVAPYMELAILSGESIDTAGSGLSDVSCPPLSTVEAPIWGSLALSTYSDREPDPALRAAFQAWRAQAKMRRLILKPYRRIVRRWHRLTEESKRGEVAWSFYRQALLQKAFNSLLYRVTTCTHLTARLGFKTLRDIATIRKHERDVADEYYCARLCAKTLRGLFQSITKRCRIFLQIQRARELRLLSHTFRHMRVEASLIALAFRIYRRITLHKVVSIWRRMLRIHVVEQRVNQVILRHCFIRWRHRYRRSLALLRDMYVRQGYDEDLALTLAIASENVCLLLRAFYSWLKRTRHKLHQKMLQSVINAFQRQHLLRSALCSITERYKTILARRQAISSCLQSIDRRTLILTLRRWKGNAQSAKIARISSNMVAREHNLLVQEQAFCAWRVAWNMHRTARARYGPLASSLNRILVRYIFHELQQKYEENRCRLERATEFHEILVKQSLHKVFSAWYVRFLEQENTVQFLSSIVHTLADRAYDVCHTRVLRPGKWFLDTPSYRLLRKAWDASWWKYKKRSAYRAVLLQADKDYNNKALVRTFSTWRIETKVSILLAIWYPRILSGTFTAWRLAAEGSRAIALMESQARMKHEYSLMHWTFCYWKHIRKVLSTERQLEQTIYYRRATHILILSFRSWHAAYLQDVYLRAKEQEVAASWSRTSLAIALRSICAAYLSRLRFRANRRRNVFTETLEGITASLSSICIGRLLLDIRTEHMRMLVHISPLRVGQIVKSPVAAVVCDQGSSLRSSPERSHWEILRGHREKYRSTYEEDSVGIIPHKVQDCGARQLIDILDNKIAALGHRLAGCSP
ncbi:hypothetical protein GL50803_004819 [Giardia duodenalis]|uniref:Uncharacterized protein n=1 Tax=Giardia intestinalis (strain ATCC 50803 / WB clone C6) TaxID=184922 RepID=D3KHU0_GIAIC|nr:hypothetical protein GL50803_004819 [Giardia intestinalis]KAE8304289.1 hypothetical protein GL50803_004819 [Giardia intestinalis]